GRPAACRLRAAGGDLAAGLAPRVDRRPHLRGVPPGRALPHPEGAQPGLVHHPARPASGELAAPAAAESRPDREADGWRTDAEEGGRPMRGRMLLQIRRYARSFAILVALAVVGTACGFYIVLRQRLPNPLLSFYPVNGAFASAAAVVPALGEPVNVAGVRVGEI